MKVVEVNKLGDNKASLEVFLRERGSFFIQQRWLDIYDASGIRVCAVLNNNGEVIGAFSYFHFKKLIFNCIITPPFSPHIALVFRNPAESVVGKNTFTKELLDSIAGYFVNTRADLIDISLPAEIKDTQPFTWKGLQSQLRYSYWLMLDQSEDTLWNRLASEKRKSINKAEKDHLQVVLADDRQCVYNLVVETLRRNKALSNQALIKEIITGSRLASDTYAFVASAGNEILGTSFCMVDGDTAVYLFGGTNPASRHHGAGVVCMWKCILHAKKMGLKKFDFEGSMQPGIERYFREFGGDLVPYPAITRRKGILSILMKISGH